jgi:acetyl esterase/lipase
MKNSNFRFSGTHSAHLSVDAARPDIAIEARSKAVATPMTSDEKTLKRVGVEMALVLSKWRDLGAKPFGTMSVSKTRNQPTLADAVTAIIAEQREDPKATAAAINVTTKDISYPTYGGSQAVRVYTPQTTINTHGRRLPVIVYYHGGGWVTGSIDTYGASAMALARKCDAIVASVDYRHAPEHKFPAQHEDAVNAYVWILQNAKLWGGDPNCVALAGESAGGNLALNVAIMARDMKLQRPVHMLLIYPVAGVDMNTPSYKKNADAMPLSRLAMDWFLQNTVKTAEDKLSPLLDILGRADLRDLPSATIITAEIDPLMSEGRMLADQLREAGTAVNYKNFSGVTHEFFGMDAVLVKAQRAQHVAAHDFKLAFAAHAIGLRQQFA